MKKLPDDVLAVTKAKKQEYNCFNCGHLNKKGICMMKFDECVLSEHWIPKKLEKGGK